MVRNAEDLADLFTLRTALLVLFSRVSATGPMTISGIEVKLLRSSSSNHLWDQCTELHDTAPSLAFNVVQNAS